MDLYAKLTLDTSDYESGLSDAEEETSSFGSKLGAGLKGAAGTAGKALLGMGAAAAAGGAAIASIANSTADYGDEVDKNSQKMGISAKAYQEWDAVLKHSGTSMSSMKSSFKKLANAADDASKDQVAAFADIGLSMEEVASLSTEDLWARTIEGLQGMEEGAHRTAVADALLGKGAVELGALFNTSAEDTQEMIDTVNDLGGVMSDEGVKSSAKFKDNLQDLQTGFTGITHAIGEAAIPMLNGLMETVNNNMPAIQETIKGAIEKAGEVITGFGESLSPIWDGIVEGAGKIKEAMGNAGIDWDSILSEMQSVVGGFAEAVGGFISDVAGFIAGLVTDAQTDGTLINDVWTAIQEAVGALVEAVGGYIDAVITTIHSLWEAANTDGTLINTIFEGIGKAVETAIGIVTGIIEGITSLLNGDFSGAVTAVQGVFETVFGAIQTAVETAISAVTSVIQGIVDFFAGGATDAVNGIQETFSSAFSIITGVIEGITETVTSVFGGIGDIVIGAFEGCAEWFSGITDVVGSVFDGITETAMSWAGSVAGFVGDAVNGAVDTVSGWAEAIGNFLFGSDDTEESAEAFEGLSEDIAEATGTANQVVSENFNDIKTIVSSSSTEAVEAVSQAYVGMANDIESALGTAYKSVVTKMNDIETKITSSTTSAVSSAGSSLNTLQGKWVSAMSDIRNTVSSYMDQIKELLNQEFSIKVAIQGGSEGGTTKMFAKAMNNGYILNGATVFGEMGGTPLVGGEAGQEMIIGTNTMMNMISQAAGGGQAAAMVQSYGEQVVAILAEYLPTLGNQKIYLNGTALVGGIANDMDKQLGKLAYQRGMVGV